MASTTDIEKLPASVLEDYVNNGDMEDVVFTATPFLTWVQKHCIEKKAGGETFRGQIRTGRNNNWQGYGPYQTWVFQPDKGYARPIWNRREHVITATLSGQEEEYNSGEMTTFDIVEETISKATKSLMEKIEKVTIQNDGTIPREAAGLALLGGDALSLYTNVGGIDSRDAPWWQSIIKRPGYGLPVINWEDNSVPWTYPTETNTTTNPFDSTDVTSVWQFLTLDMLDEMVDLMKNVDPSEAPMLLLTTSEIKRAIIRLVKADGAVVQRDTTGTLVGGYDNVVYRNLTIIDSVRCPRGTMYFLSNDSFRVRVTPNRWLSTRPWATPYDQDAKYMGIFAWFQCYTLDRRGIGIFTNVSHK